MGNPYEELALKRQRLKDAVSLDYWDDFVREQNFPIDLLPALAARKPELIEMARRRPLTADEAAKLYHLLVKLIRTNEALRAHAEETARMVGNWTEAIEAMQAHAYTINDFANFREKSE